MLAAEFLKLMQESNSITHNPLFLCFDLEELAMLDASQDKFVTSKKKNILKLIKGIGVDFNPKLKSAYDEYREALTYLMLKEKFPNSDRIPEEKTKTPDFKIPFIVYDNGDEVNYSIYAELKSMAFSDGNLNYKNTMEQGLNAQIELEIQVQQGKNVAFAITEIQPMHKSGKKYNPSSTKYAIESLIEKIEQNIKPDQFSFGDTVLIIDLKQLTLPSFGEEGAMPVYVEQQFNSFVSGVQWNVAFGKRGHLLFKQIEFEGKENTDGELEKEGILVSRDWIKALIFFDYTLSDVKPKVVGLFRANNTTDAVEHFLHQFCDIVNDDQNSRVWKLNNPA